MDGAKSTAKRRLAGVLSAAMNELDSGSDRKAEHLTEHGSGLSGAVASGNKVTFPIGSLLGGSLALSRETCIAACG